MSSFLYSTLKLGAGTIYPAYESFKAVKTRNVKVRSAIHAFAISNRYFGSQMP